MLKPQELIRKKRDKLKLSADEIDQFFNGFLRDEVTDYQMSAMLMSIFLNGMSRDETVELTKISLNSGEKFTWSFDQKIVADKHSTGGVGDKSSLVIMPLAVLEGLKVPMMSGRGLGHTGGTLDKLESIPGMNVFPDANMIRKQTESIGGVFLGQTPEITALDKRLYALRDVTATVESIPLITVSIISKKLAEGLDHLVLDVKYGSGAFLSDKDEARKLAASLVSVGKECGMGVRALLTDMNSPLGHTAGHTLEVAECMEVLKGAGPEDTKELSIELTAEMVHQAFPERPLSEIRESLNAHLQNGKAFETFCQIIAVQGGDTSYLEDCSKFAKAPVIKALTAENAGYIAKVDVRSLGIAILGLGGGRIKTTDKINPRVGLSSLGRVGKWVDQNEELAIIHAESEADWQEAASLLRNAIKLQESRPQDLPLIFDRM